MPARFQLLAAHPALDFVNTLDNRFASTGPTELLVGYADLLTFADQSGLLNSRQITALRKQSRPVPARKALARAHALREVLSSVFYGIALKGRPPTDSLRGIEEECLAAQSHRRLIWTPPAAGDEGQASAEWVFGGSEDATELPLWAVAESAVTLLTSRDVNQVHECGSPTCRWLFLDTSKNHTRRWCDMAICGNRMKARRFHARQ
jgi:predicted RNA-binding Zn ribbon-like protein